MNAPSNRRVSRPILPPDVLDASARESSFEAEPDARRSVAPERPSPRSSARVAQILGIVRAALGAALVVSVSSAVAWAARRYVMTSPRFAVTDIVVTGAQRRTSDEILRESGLTVGANVFSADLDEARARLIADPWIREAVLARRLPGTLYVEVAEREAAGIVALGDTYLVSRDGDVIKRLEPGDPSDLPVITGITPDALQDDREGVTRQLRRALDLAGDYDHGPLGHRAPLQEIHIARDSSITLIVGKNGLALVLGDPPFRRKLEQASRVITELERQGAKADAVMLDNEARPERVVVRMR